MDFKAVTVEVAKLELRPEDTLVLTVRGDCPHDYAREMGKHVEKTTGHSRILILNSDGVELSVITPLDSHVQD